MKCLTVCARVPNIYVATSIYTRIWWKNYTQAGKSVFLEISQKIQYCTMYILYQCTIAPTVQSTVLYALGFSLEPLHRNYYIHL